MHSNTITLWHQTYSFFGQRPPKPEPNFPSKKHDLGLRLLAAKVKANVTNCFDLPQRYLQMVAVLFLSEFWEPSEGGRSLLRYGRRKKWETCSIEIGPASLLNQTMIFRDMPALPRRGLYIVVETQSSASNEQPKTKQMSTSFFHRWPFGIVPIDQSSYLETHRQQVIAALECKVECAQINQRHNH